MPSPRPPSALAADAPRTAGTPHPRLYPAWYAVTLRRSRCSNRQNRRPLFRPPSGREFRAFLNTVEANAPDDLDVHIVIDNVSSHNTQAIRNWFARRPRWHVDYTPTSASWLNQIERFFANPTEKQNPRGVPRSPPEPEAAIKAYIETVNANPRPIVWTKSADAILAPLKRFCLANLKTAQTQAEICKDF